MGNLEHEIKDIKRKYIKKAILTSLKGSFIASVVLSLSTYLVYTGLKHLFLSLPVYWKLFILYFEVFKNNCQLFLFILSSWFVLGFIACIFQDIQNIKNKTIEEKIEKLKK